MSFFRSSAWLKAVAIALALLTYYYIHYEVYGNRARKTDASYKLFKPTIKRIPIKARIASEAPAGYEIVMEQVSIVPNELVVIGPEAMLDDQASIETALIDVQNETATFTRKIPIENIAGTTLGGDVEFVDVVVPIRKINSEK